MKKIDSTVWKETRYIFLSVLILSLFMQSVFLLIGQWNYTVLLGNLLSGSCAVLNFFLMGMTLQSAMEKEEKAAKAAMRMSQSLRMVMVFAVAAVGTLLSCFHTAAVLVPLFFPRIAIGLRPLLDKRSTGTLP